MTLFAKRPGTNDERPQDRQVLYCAHDPARSEGIPPAHEAEIRRGIPAAEQVRFRLPEE